MNAPARIAAFAAVMLLAASCGYILLASRDRGAFDFQAFYCAGSAARAGADPYRTQPLGACEHRESAGTYAALPANVVLPAPQPGYDIAAFALLSLLPFQTAKAVWGALLAAAIFIAVLATIGATRAPPDEVAIAFAVSLVFPALAFGELFALFAAAACAAIYFAAIGRWSAAGIAGALCLIEPHLGLPVCFALAIWRPQTRAAIAAMIAGLAGIAIAMLGVHANAEYVATVLPLHALAELGSDAQLSISTLLHAAGLPDGIATLGGVAFYAALAIAGIVLGRMLAARSGSDAFIPAVPAAFAAMGGTFIHVTEIFAALPLALLLVTERTRYRAIFTGALLLLAVPWYMALERGNAAGFAGLAAVVVFYLAWRRMRTIAGAAVIGTVTWALLLAAPTVTGLPALHAHAPVAITDTSYPQASWQAWVDRELSSGSAASWFLRGLSWSGLLLLGAGTVLVLRDPDRLHIHEFMNPGLGEFSAVPAAFDAAER
jgi:hypothetical protein